MAQLREAENVVDMTIIKITDTDGNVYLVHSYWSAENPGFSLGYTVFKESKVVFDPEVFAMIEEGLDIAANK
jgi:hypothetical protein